ncbi:PRD domain-containing protein [Sporolactobacillus sp. STSJ-5]|uniref:BglG family transcription antiterminator n=1 Tax=Sporolactobacillus sp. STSJ-5 TaxID=2965076 RepID=UPI0021076E7A|nr:PRD domain-containing protein [Sporolactobacillus sp. STSJ-5]MCQ2009493.1 PRD domain-containing protein [Sporolactobacillus sp. STSJ-5]
MTNTLNDRQKRILEILKQTNDYITAAELSRQFAVSTKTIYRDMKQITETSSQNYRIEKKENLGYMLVNKKQTTESGAPVFQMPEERRLNLLLYLLAISPYKTSIQKISERYYVSQSSIINDFKHIEAAIVPFNLKLLKENSGTHICGNKLNVLRLSSSIIEGFLKQNGDPFNQYDIPEFIEHTKVKNATLFQVKDFLHEVQQEHNAFLDQPSYLTMFCYMLSVIEGYTNNIQKPNANKPIVHQIRDDSAIFHVTYELVNKIEKFYQIKLNNDEFNELYYIFKACNLNHDSLLDQDPMSRQAMYLSSKLVSRVSENSGLFFQDDDVLYKQLTSHLCSMIYRLNHKINIVNPILNSIRTNFGGTFDLVKQCVYQVVEKENYADFLSDEEVGYITLYFQILIDKFMKEIPILIECTSGIGTSHLLSEKIKKMFPQINVKRIVAQHRIKESDYADVALIISTVKTRHNANKPTLLVSPILNDTDKYNIEKFINDYYKEANERIGSNSPKESANVT